LDTKKKRKISAKEKKKGPEKLRGGALTRGVTTGGGNQTRNLRTKTRVKTRNGARLRAL